MQKPVNFSVIAKSVGSLEECARFAREIQGFFHFWSKKCRFSDQASFRVLFSDMFPSDSANVQKN